MLDVVEGRFAAFAGDAAAPQIRPVAARNLKIARRNRTLLDVADFVVGGCGVTVLMGPNGAGKSLLLKCLAGLVPPDSGTVSWGSAPPDRRRAARLGFVFQKPVLLRRSAHANIRHALRITGAGRREAARRADAALADVGLSHLAGMPARVLSGGEQQRLAIARALALRPECLFLDEPTASLDPASVAAIETVTLAAGRRGVKIVFVTHDPAQARRIATDVAFVSGGRIVERAHADAFFQAPHHPAAQAFLAGRLFTPPTTSEGD